MCNNIQNCCRICLNKDTEHVSILKDHAIQLHWKSCLAIAFEENDELPKVLCVSCATQLEEFYNFQLSARCTHDWLESVIRERTQKQTEQKAPIQPLPDSEYNSDSLLEFLNNTENIEEYLNNLGKDDIPSIVNMFDKNNENSMDIANRAMKQPKSPSPKKKENRSEKEMHMEIDILDSDVEIVKELLIKETNISKTKIKLVDRNTTVCFGCKVKFESSQKLIRHYSMCLSYNDFRLCISCNILFDSKQKLLQHKEQCHTTIPATCICGKLFNSKNRPLNHYKKCCSDIASAEGYKFRCKQCGVTFRDRFLLYKHAEEHVIKAQTKMCDECGHNFIGEAALSMHKKKLHPLPDNLLYRCKVCYKQSRDRRELYNHIQKHHTAALESQRHLCDACGRCFATRAVLMHHKLKHSKKTALSITDNNCHKNIVKHGSDICMCECCGAMVNSGLIAAHMKEHVT